MNNGKPIIRPKFRKAIPKVTIAIGVICGSGNEYAHSIVLASDSQTTYGELKSLDTKKISIVEFADAKILVAQAGTADLAEKTIIIMQDKAKGVKLENHETVERIAQESIKEVRKHLVDVNKDCNFTADDWKRFFYEQNYFKLLIAYFCEQTPCLFTIDIDWCMPIPAKKPYIAIGCGKDMGEYLLREYQRSDRFFEYAPLIACAVVEKTIDNVDGCGRPTWAGVVFPTKTQTGHKSECVFFTRKYMDLMIQELNEAEQKQSEGTKKHIEMVLEEIGNKYNNLITSEI